MAKCSIYDLHIRPLDLHLHPRAHRCHLPCVQSTPVAWLPKTFRFLTYFLSTVSYTVTKSEVKFQQFRRDKVDICRNTVTFPSWRVLILARYKTQQLFLRIFIRGQTIQTHPIKHPPRHILHRGIRHLPMQVDAIRLGASHHQIRHLDLRGSMRSPGVGNPHCQLSWTHAVGFAKAALFHPVICLTIVVTRNWLSNLAGKVQRLIVPTT